MRRPLATSLIAAGAGIASTLLVAPTAVASPLAEDAPSAAVVTAEWSMQSSGVTVPDPDSGLTLKLSGSWSALPGQVRFGADGARGLALADDVGRLSPRKADFAVVAAFTTATVPTTGGYSPNVVQKGLFGTGGQWKMQLHPSKQWGTLAECRFEGDKGSVIVRDGRNSRLDDGRSHVVACWRSGTRLGVTVDGKKTLVSRSVGKIAPETGVTLANQSTAGSVGDQFNGSISCVVAAIGPSSLARAQSRSGC